MHGHEMQEILEQCELGQGGTVRGGNLKAVAQVGWAAALLDLADLAERCASRAAGSQDIAPRTWADLIRAQQQIAQDQAARQVCAVVHLNVTWIRKKKQGQPHSTCALLGFVHHITRQRPAWFV